MMFVIWDTTESLYVHSFVSDLFMNIQKGLPVYGTEQNRIYSYKIQ